MKELEILLKLLYSIIFDKNYTELFLSFSDTYKQILYTKISEYKLSHFIYYHLFPFLDEKWIKNYRDEYAYASSLEIKREFELKNIFQFFNEHNINAAPIKGAFLAYFAYPNPTIRRMSDIDILIPKEQINEAFEILIYKGYKKGYGDIESHHKPALLSPYNINIELHHHIKSFDKHNDQKYFDSEILWKNSQISDFFGIKINLLAPEIYMLHILDHFFHDHLAGGLRTYIDVAYIISKYKPDKMLLFNQAEEMKLNKELALFLTIFKNFLPQEYVCSYEQDIEYYVNYSNLILLNYNKIFSNPNYKLGFYREFKTKKIKDKLLFIKNELMKDPKYIKTKYNIKKNNLSLIFYYLLFYFQGIIKFLKCLLFRERDNILINSAKYQNKINFFLNK